MGNTKTTCGSSILPGIVALLLSLQVSAQQNATLDYPQVAFDSDTCCWRQLAANARYGDAANLIVAYINTHKQGNLHALRWHAGQQYAKAGNNAMAIKYFGKTYNVFYRWFGGADGAAWYFYAKGSVAFLKRNRSQLQHILYRWDRKLPKDRNYTQLTMLNQQWDKRYRDALK